MRRALVAIAVLSPMFVAAYACTTDTFTSDGGAEGGGVTQGEFCDAEALYVHNCGFDDAACVQADLKNCGAVFAAFSDGFAAAFARCMELGQLPCGVELSKILTSTCMTQQLAGYVNDSGVLATLANDYCSKCEKGNGACVDTFASASDPGYLPSLFSDTVIQKIDDCEKKIDGGVILTADGSVSCLQQSNLCEVLAIGTAGPPSACTTDQ